MGLSGALETLCGQAYGARQLAMLGVYLQRGFVVLGAMSVPVAVLWLFLEPILVALGQRPEIAHVAGIYAFYLIPELFALALFQPLVRFMQAQNVTAPLAWCSLGALAVHIPANYALIHGLGLGVRGAAAASSLTWWFTVALLAAYASRSGALAASWRGWSRAAFEDLGAFVRLALPSCSMVCLEYWCFEAMVLLCGLLPNPQLEVSALSVCLNTAGLCYMIPLGLAGAASTRVAHGIGEGRPQHAKLAAHVALALAMAQGLLQAVLLYSVREHWGWLFTNSQEVTDLVVKLLNVQVVLVVLDGLNGTMSGVLRGSGSQLLGSVANLFAYYVVGLPLAVYLAFWLDLRAWGLWAGVTFGLLMQSLVIVPVSLCIDYNVCVKAAYARAQVSDMFEEELASKSNSQ